MTRRQFGYCRRARNHIAAQALRDGVIMNGDDFSDLCDEDFDDGTAEGSSPARAELEALVEYTALTEEQRATLRLNDRDPHDWLSLYACCTATAAWSTG